MKKDDTEEAPKETALANPSEVEKRQEQQEM